MNLYSLVVLNPGWTDLDHVIVAAITEPMARKAAFRLDVTGPWEDFPVYEPAIHERENSGTWPLREEHMQWFDSAEVSCTPADIPNFVVVDAEVS